MASSKRPAKGLGDSKQKRFSEAKKNFEKMQKELAPFIRQKQIGKGYSTVGKWCESLVFCES
jgi:hypothetical protein